MIVALVFVIAMAVLGCASVLLYGRRLRDGYQKPKALSPRALRALYALGGEKPDFATPCHLLSIPDAISIYSNSRVAVLEAHRLKLKCPSREEVVAGCAIAEERHLRLKLLLILSVWERALSVMSRTRLPLYARAVLWTYLEIREAVSQMAEDCGDTRATAMMERLY